MQSIGGEVEAPVVTAVRQVLEFRMQRVTTNRANGQRRWRLVTSTIILNQLLLFVLYVKPCTATNEEKISGNKWFDCGDRGDQVYVTNTRMTWVPAEQFCQRQGRHLVSFPQLTTCKSSLLPLLVLDEVHTSYTRLLDGLHYRDVGNNLQLSDGLVNIKRTVDNCSVAFLGGAMQPLELEETRCDLRYSVVCGRNADTQAASIVCDSRTYTYHSISFSADHANQTCYQQYGGRPLSTDGQELSCASQLLNTSQVLSNNNVSYIPVYTNITDGSHCTIYQPSTNTTHHDSCTVPRPTICVSWYCNHSDNLVVVPNEDRCVCKRGYLRTSAHTCESIVELLSSTGQAAVSSNITVFSWLESEWKVDSVYTQNTLYQLDNLSLSEGRFAIRSAGRIIYTFSESLQQADTAAADLAKNHSQFITVNGSANDILVPTAPLRNLLVNLSLWFRPHQIECTHFTNANQSNICSYSLFNESVQFKDGLYEFALSPHNSPLLSIPVLYRVHPRPTTTAPPPYGMSSLSSEGSLPWMISSSSSETDVAPPAKASMAGLYIGIGGAVVLAALVLIVYLVVVVRHKMYRVSLQHQRSGCQEAAGERSANNRHGAGAEMRYQSVKHASSSSVIATNSTQESAAAASSAESCAPHPSQDHNYDDIELPAFRTSTMPSSTGTTATTPGSGNRELSLRRPNRFPDAAVECTTADNNYMTPHDLCLARDAGENDTMAAAATTNVAATPNSTTVTTASTSTTTPITDASMSSAATSASTPVFQSEEEARAASLPTAVAGPVYAEVFLAKKVVVQSNSLLGESK
ncbi:uncharacterized protein LOC135825955 isoform X2 [Sycon ciliatum]|uniref:uncharacterized protein LOC135825955 isoform X2 n=1 Tax=Sycon ciliatum TaxID=27933 RepID=UPI0031F6EB0C